MSLLFNMLSRLVITFLPRILKLLVQFIATRISATVTPGNSHYPIGSFMFILFNGLKFICYHICFSVLHSIVLIKPWGTLRDREKNGPPQVTWLLEWLVINDIELETGAWLLNWWFGHAYALGMYYYPHNIISMLHLLLQTHCFC